MCQKILTGQLSIHTVNVANFSLRSPANWNVDKANVLTAWQLPKKCPFQSKCHLGSSPKKLLPLGPHCVYAALTHCLLSKAASPAVAMCRNLTQFSGHNKNPDADAETTTTWLTATPVLDVPAAVAVAGAGAGAPLKLLRNLCAQYAKFIVMTIA